jgi:hypothetical protein
VNVEETCSAASGPWVAAAALSVTSVTPGMCTPGPAMLGSVPRRRGTAGWLPVS